MTHDYKILPSTIVDPTEAEKEKAMEAAEPLMAFGISCACLVADGRTGEAKGWAIGAEGSWVVLSARDRQLIHCLLVHQAFLSTGLRLPALIFRRPQIILAT